MDRRMQLGLPDLYFELETHINKSGHGLRLCPRVWEQLAWQFMQVAMRARFSVVRELSLNAWLPACDTSI